MEQNKDNQPDENDKSDRREAMQKLGRFAAYAAPFTVLAMTKKADAATGHGPGRHRERTREVRLWEFPVDDGLVLVRPDVQGFFLLNETARLVWCEFGQGLTSAEIASGIAAHFCVSPEVARRDVEATMASWRDGLLASSPPAVRLPPSAVEWTDVCPLDCVVNGNPMRVVLQLGDVWDEIAPRLEPVRSEAPLPRHTFAVGSAAGRVLVFRDGTCIGNEENSAAARAILLQAMAALAEPVAILHAGGCGGVLLAGHSHCGKSTLCAALMGRGLPYHCDDSAVLDRQFRVTPMPFPLMLRSGSWPLIEHRFPAFKDAPVYRRWGTEVRFLTPVTDSRPRSRHRPGLCQTRAGSRHRTRRSRRARHPARAPAQRLLGRAHPRKHRPLSRLARRNPPLHPPLRRVAGSRSHRRQLGPYRQNASQLFFRSLIGFAAVSHTGSPAMTAAGFVTSSRSAASPPISRVRISRATSSRGWRSAESCPSLAIACTSPLRSNSQADSWAAFPKRSVRHCAVTCSRHPIWFQLCSRSKEPCKTGLRSG